MIGIKETKEALVGANELGLFLVKRLKDGVGFDDFTAVFEALKNDSEFKMKLEAAYNGINQVPAEIKDIDLTEAVTLVMTQVEYVPKFVEALKK